MISTQSSLRLNRDKFTSWTDPIGGDLEEVNVTKMLVHDSCHFVSEKVVVFVVVMIQEGSLGSRPRFDRENLSDARF